MKANVIQYLLQFRYLIKPINLTYLSKFPSKKQNQNYRLLTLSLPRVNYGETDCNSNS